MNFTAFARRIFHFHSIKVASGVIGISTLIASGGIIMSTNKVIAEHPWRVSFEKINPNEWMSAPITPLSKLDSDNSHRSQMEQICMELQARLCRAMEKMDEKGKFRVDKWDRKAGGGGISCVLEDGNVFEKAGVNISAIYGTLSPEAIKQMRARHGSLDISQECNFVACGISSVIHPRNPFAPTTHFNFRYFELQSSDGRKLCWFGGGSDLTPYYLFDEDAKHFHHELKSACDKHDKSYYARFKKWCDEYFFLNHRGEGRGVGGLFFDDLEDENGKTLEFVRTCAEAIIPAYLPIVQKRKDTKYTDKERDWQLMRRGRYVEFNLLYDRGTKFGLATPEARIESILMSLPLNVKWSYCYPTPNDSRATRLLDVLRKPVDWC